MKAKIKCLKCGATAWASAQADVQGDGVMTGEVIETGERTTEWQGGNSTCDHDVHEQEVLEVEYGYDPE